MSSRSLRICMLTTFYPPYNFGGDGIFIQRLCEALARRGHRIEVIHNADAYRISGGEPVAEAAENGNPRVHSLQSKTPALSLLLTHQLGKPVAYAAAIQRILNAGQFDVIHYHNISLLGPGVLDLGSAIKLYTTHEYWLVCPTHVLWKLNREPCVQKSCLACTVFSGRPPQLWRYSHFLARKMRNLDVVLCPSRFALKRHQQEGIQSPLVYLPPFVPILPEENRDRHSPHYFLVVARLEKLKGVQTLLPVFSTYKQAELWIAGEGNYKEELRRQASGNPRVRFLGFRSESELRKLYRDALALVVPSLCYEVFGMVVLEAFAQQTPVIAHRIGALTELVEASQGGLLYSDEDELLAALTEIQGNAARRDSLGKLGKARLLDCWTEEQHLDRYLGLIYSLERNR